jgi:hypothetical protein
MKANVGGIDKLLRIAVGIALLAAAAFMEGPLRWWGLVGIVPLATGLFNFCPLYTVLGLNTCPLERKGA